MNEFRKEPAELIEAELRSCERVLRSGWFVLGQEVEAFEREWASSCGAMECVATGNGLDSIEIGLRASGVGVGDEVITTPITAFATTLAVLRTGATPVFADIAPDTGLLEIEDVERRIGLRTKGILIVHLYGQLMDIEAWVSLCAKYGIELWEDCAQCHGAAHGSRRGGCGGAWGAYSFYPTKNLGCAGDGGALVTNDRNLAERSRALRNYGQVARYEHRYEGLNSRLDEIQAAILRERMKWLSAFNERRRSLAATYNRALAISEHVRPLNRGLECNDVYHLYVVKTRHREALRAYLEQRGIATLAHYPVPVHRQPALCDRRFADADLPRADSFASQCLSLPCHPQMTENDASRIAAEIAGWRPSLQET